MSIHDYVVDNGTGQAVRVDINLALEAIRSNNSNGSDPVSQGRFAYMWWADSGNEIMKVRDSGNSNWIELFKFGTGGDHTVTLSNGSASAPALSFRTDLNTGLYLSGSNKLNFASDGVERLELGTTTIFNEDGADVDFRIEGDTNPNLFYVDAGNNRVGIGLSSPAGDLHVQGAAGSSGVIYLTDGDATGVTNSFIIQKTSTTTILEDRQSGSSIKIGTADSTRMTIDSSGNIGINTESPSKKLHILGANEEDLVFLGTGNTGGNTFAGIRGDNEAGIRIRGGGSARGGEIDFGGGLRNTDPALIKFSATTGSSFSEKARINASGRFGIGATDASTGQLVVYRQTTGAGNPVIEARSNHTSTNSVKFSIDGDGEAFFANQVGINVTAPACALHIKSIADQSITGIAQ